MSKFQARQPLGEGALQREELVTMSKITVQCTESTEKINKQKSKEKGYNDVGDLIKARLLVLVVLEYTMSDKILFKSINSPNNAIRALNGAVSVEKSDRKGQI